MQGIWASIFGLVGGFVLAVFFIYPALFPMFLATCYESGGTRIRTRELTKDYLGRVSKYHTRGVLSDKAYGKIVGVMERESRFDE